MVQDFPPNATPNVHCGKRIFGDEGDTSSDFCNEPKANTWRFIFVVQNRLAEFLISFGKEF